MKKWLQNKCAKKASQKPLQKSILGRILASKTHPKSSKKPSKNDVEKRLEKKSLQDPQKKPVLARNGKREHFWKLLKHATAMDQNFQQGATRPAEAEAPKAAAASREKYQTAAEQCMHNGPWKPRGSTRELRSPQAMKTNPLRTQTSFSPQVLVKPLENWPMLPWTRNLHP